MSQRPTFIDIPNTPLEHVARPLFSSHGDVASPLAGQIPPALSPLDAFAFHGRLLQKRFEDGDDSGRRLSRLPSTVVASELAKARPNYFRSQSQADVSPIPEEAMASLRITQVRHDDRPMSQYPLLQSEPGAMVPSTRPQPFQNGLARVTEDRRLRLPGQDHIGDGGLRNPNSLVQTVSNGGSVQPPRFDQSTMVSRLPPASPRAPWTLANPNASPSITAVLADGQDDVEALTLEESLESTSLRTPASPFRAQPPRSPSLASEHSFSSSILPRPSFNYSRPLSRTGGLSMEGRTGSSFLNRQDSMNSTSTRPSLDVPRRSALSDSPVTPFGNDMVHTPIGSVTSEEYFSNESHNGASYIYSKYALPRGKSIKRESIGVEEFFNQQISWNDPARHADTAGKNKIPPRAYVGKAARHPVQPTQPPERRRPTEIMVPQHSPASLNEPFTQVQLRHSPSSPSTLTSESSTVKARSVEAKKPATELSPEEQFQKGIECHEKGSLQESTYHFRLASKSGHSRAMLFYALACRHGWGMKPNPSEAIVWLQKAVDSTQLEVAEDEDLVQRGQRTDFMERKSHKAQFALSVYELGVSYMNGWGVQQDKSLALRCFEIAGNWGDVDALAEAGFCYAEGVGCKKDLKKAAKFYREAEAKGMSMAGNSWIYKEKYMADGDERRGRGAPRESADKKRSKSRTRNFFARKKSMTT